MKEEEHQLQTITNQKKQPLINSTSSYGDDRKLSKKAAKSLEKYRKKLLAQVITIFLICLIVILQRVFYQIIVQAEDGTLAQFQLYTDLVESKDQKIVPSGIKNGFLKFYGSLSEFSVQFLFLTHFLATLFVAFDAFLTTKVIFVTMLVTYLISVLQMFYAGARPFWSNQQIMASCCLQPYNHPSLGLVLVTFVPCYTYYIWRKKIGNNIKQTPIKHISIGIALIAITIITQFVNYMIGTIYLINIFMSLVISVLLLMITVASNSIVDNSIKRSTILKTDAKKYVFYWLLFICLLGTFILIVFSGQDLFLDIDWVDNYMKCTKYQDYADKSYRYDEIIGPWFNFISASTLFGWIGAVFGISSVFRTIPNIEWAGGSYKNRFLRALITNILIIPSWFFILLIQNRGNWIHNIGLNDFIVNAIHFFILYLWIFGYSPILLHYKLFKLTNKEDEEFYVVVDDTDVKVPQ